MREYNIDFIIFYNKKVGVSTPTFLLHCIKLIHKQLLTNNYYCCILSFYYLIDDAIIPDDKQNDYTFIENDEGELVNLDFKWIMLDDVEKYDIRPVALKKVLKERKFDFNHILVK